MEKEILLNQNTDNENKISYCDKLLKYQTYMIIIFVVLSLLIWTFTTLSYQFNENIIYIIILKILEVLINILPIIWLIVIPIYWYSLKKKGFLEKECFKKILINASLPIVIPLIAFWWCAILFSFF